MFKRGDLVIYKGKLYKVYSEVRLNGTIRLRALKKDGGEYIRVYVNNCLPATSLMKELI